ncbi:MAG TPA: AMIN domain-containing protein, partial [Methylomirabilota bacterium]|nr:AMIN domain-containing protein [Methylomirabilota bacterium]
MHAVLALVIGLLLFPTLALAAAAETTPPSDAARAKVSDVTVTERSDSTRVHIRTTGAAKYRAEFIDSPWRLVIDLDDTVYAWRKTPLPIGKEPLKQVRGGQYRKGVTRVVVEFTRKSPYAIREDADGLAIIVPTVHAEAPNDTASAAVAATPAPGPAPTPIPPAQAPKAPAQVREPGVPAAAVREAPAPVRIAQAQAAPAPAGTGRPISLEFKDADVVNLLRILAAESGRNVVIGEDVKGKMSISLRNVPWQLALDTILEARGLQKIEKDGVLRIVSTEQLTKEREAQARVNEAKIKGEAEARAKLADAQVKEAEAQTKRLAAQAAAKEQEAKGPLREETVRLSYADPDEVAKTLQGILGIPAEGAKIQGPGYLGLPGPPNPELGVGYQGAPPAGPVPAVTPVSVSQDVLARGLTIRAHKPTNTLFLRLYEADLERVKTIIREALDIPLPQVKIEARMEILDRSALEQIGIQWGGATAQTPGNMTLVGQGFQTTQVGGQTVGFLPGIVQGSQNVIDLVPANGGAGFGPGVLAQPSVIPPAIPPATGGFPISFQTGLPAGGNLINLPISALPNAGPLPAAGIAFGLVGS